MLYSLFRFEKQFTFVVFDERKEHDHRSVLVLALGEASTSAQAFT